jgi:hypothetical protein
MQNGRPIILIEAKSIQEQLTKHDSQLFRYFGTTTAKFAILTNGMVYRFYTDLDEQNKMDTTPFFEFNLFEIKDHQIAELYKFRKENFNVENIITTAAELKYTSEIKLFLKKQWETPSDDFIKFIISDVYPGLKTRQVIEKFNGIVKKSLKEFVNDILNDRLKVALANTNSEEIETNNEVAATKATDIAIDAPDVVTTQEEIEGYITIKVLLKEIVSPDRVHYRDNLSYLNVLLDNSIRKWICRLHLGGTTKTIQFNDDNKTSMTINNISEILDHKRKLLDVAKKFM